MEEQEKIVMPMQSLSEEMLAQKVIIHYNSAKAATQTWREDLWPKYFGMYMQKHESESSRVYRSKIYIPLVFDQIRVLAPYLMQTIFNSDPVFKMNDATGMNDKEKKAVERLIQRQVDAMNLYPKMYSFILNMLIYGTAVGKVYWESDVKQKKIVKKVKKLSYRKNLLGIPIPTLTEVEEPGVEDVVKFFGPQMTNIDLIDFVIDPKATQLEGFWKGHVVEKTLRQLKNVNKQKKIYKNLEILAMKVATASSETEEQRLKNERKETNLLHVDSEGTSEPKVDASATEDTKIKLLEYWYPDDTKFCLVALDYGIVVRESENVFEHERSPFFSAVFQPIPGEFYGMGIPQIIYGLQKNVNTITNQRNDNINLIINRMWKYKKDSGVNPNTLKSVPGGLVGVDEMTDVEPFEMPDVTQSAYQEIINNKNEAMEALGTKYLSGANSSGSNKTATGVRLNQNAESQSVMGIFRLLDSTGLQIMVNMFYELNMQFNDKDSVVEIIGEKGKVINFTVTPKQFKKYRTLYCAGISSVMQRDTQVHQMEQFLAITARIPQELLLAWKINIPTILKKIWEAMGLEDSEMIIGGESEENTANEVAGIAMQQEFGANAAAGAAEQLTQPTPANTLSAGNQGGGEQGTRMM